MMLTAAVAAADEPRDDVGTRGADVPDEIADDLVVPPLQDGLLEAERVAEINRAREELLCAVEPVNLFASSVFDSCPTRARAL